MTQSEKERLDKMSREHYIAQLEKSLDIANSRLETMTLRVELYQLLEKQREEVNELFDQFRKEAGLPTLKESIEQRQKEELLNESEEENQ